MHYLLFCLVIEERICLSFFFFQAEDGIRALYVTGVQTCALPISPDPVELQRPKLPEHGDLSSPVALGLARELGQPARQIAEQIAARLRELPAARDLLAAVEVAGPGFINLRL